MTADPLTHNLVRFVRHLRHEGLAVVPETTVALLEAAQAVGLEERQDVYWAFRAVTVVRQAEIPVFDEAFSLFFGGPGGEFRLEPIGIDTRPNRAGGAVIASQSVMADLGNQGDTDATAQVGASGVERLASRDFAELTPEEHAVVRRMIARMIWQPAATLSRRIGPSLTGSRPHLRRNLRQLVGPSRDLMPLSMAAPKPRQRPLLVLADVSGSMERYTEMLLYFVHAARGSLGRVEAFVFSTMLTRITRELRHRDPTVALAMVGSTVPEWAGGTLIGAALAEFNETWSRRVTRGGPIALIISDGWDRGEPAVLRKEMAALARSVHRVVWLNPLAGRAGYAPEVAGMRAVLPYVDDFMPSANLADLSAVVRLLESVPKRKESRR
ncbi:MAG: VWA domain-containing protein [Acidimicrobiia bacterium]|nr:VWA domain-containing protein [Acidimicrobiia bacterium]